MAVWNASYSMTVFLRLPRLVDLGTWSRRTDDTETPLPRCWDDAGARVTCSDEKWHKAEDGDPKGHGMAATRGSGHESGRALAGGQAGVWRFQFSVDLHLTLCDAMLFIRFPVLLSACEPRATSPRAGHVHTNGWGRREKAQKRHDGAADGASQPWATTMTHSKGRRGRGPG